MKRLIALMIIFLNVNLFAKEPVLILKKDSVIEDTSGNEKMFSKGDRFLFGHKGVGYETGLGVDLSDPLTIEIFFSDSNGEGYISNINDMNFSRLKNEKNKSPQFSCRNSNIVNPFDYKETYEKDTKKWKDW